MKNAKIIFTFVLIALIFFWIKGHSQTTENALLWQVTGNDISEPSYIYGTMHMMCEEDFEISDNLQSALKRVDNLVLEVNLGAPDFMAQMQAAMASPVPLSQKLSKEEFNSLDSLLMLKTSMSLKMLDNLSLQAISSLMMAKSLPCDAPKSFEFELLAIAQKQEKEILGLETVPQQMDFFAKAFSDEFLLQQLFKVDMHEEVFKQMVESYKQQNLNELYKSVTDEKYADTETEKWLLIERNKNWMKLFPEMLKNESNLIAVGAAHLVGDYGIIKLLEDKGYEVKPVNN